MESLFATAWIPIRIFLGVGILALLLWSFRRLSSIRIWDILLYGGIGAISLWIIVDPSATDKFIFSRIREIPLGRLVALLIFAQFFWLAVFLILRERSRNQLERFHQLVLVLSAEFEKLKAEINSNKFQEIMVVLPAFREEENISAVLEKIPKEVEGHSIGVLVAVDGIGDPTYDVVREKFPEAIAIRQVVQIGSGGALHLGYQMCAMHGVRIVVSMDSDGQHSPEELPSLLKPVLEGNLDVVIGNRLQGGWEVESLWRFVGLHIFGFVIRRLMRIHAWDCSNTYRAFLLDPIMSLGLVEAQYHTLELIFKAHRTGLRIGEVPIRILARKHGTSKKGNTFYYGYQFLKRLFRYGMPSKKL